MRINLRVEYNNGDAKEITCSAKDLVAFEDKTNRSVVTLEKDMRLTDLFWLAWHSESRTGSTKKDFDSWLDDIDGVTASEIDPK